MVRRFSDPLALEAPIRFGDSFARQYPWARKLATEATVNVVRTSALLEERVGILARRYGVSSPGSNVLGILDGAGEPLPPHIISERLFSSPATLTGLLDSLEKRGLVRRTAHPTDRRKLLVEITEEGRRLSRSLLSEILREEVQWMACFNDEELETLVGLLGKLQAHLYGLSSARPGDEAEA